MVLADTDLTALVDWTRAHLALRRYRDGWGVVCGLDVRCDPDRAGWVRVDPGFALGCCGEDIVVCEPEYIDLTGCCVVEEACPDPAEKVTERNPCGDVVVDLLLEAEDVPAVTELVDLCGCGGRCSNQRVIPTRVREGAHIRCCRVTLPDADPTAEAAERWQAAYSKCHEIVARYVKAGAKAPTGDDVLAWLRKQDLDPPCDWWGTTCESLRSADGSLQLDSRLAAALLDLVVDCRHRLLRRGCEPCSSGDRLRLARVWLRRPDADRGEASCVVVRVDAYAPYRRELAPWSRPVAAGAYDLAPFIWQRWEQVCGRWRTLTGDSHTELVEYDQSTVGLLELLGRTDWVSWTCGEDPPVPVLVTTGCLGTRVLGFGSRADFARTKQVPPNRPDTVEAAGVAEPLVQHLPTPPAPASAAPDAAAAAQHPPATPAPAGAAPAVELEDVTGIGRAYANKLVAGGITSVEELAAADLDHLVTVLGRAADANRIRQDARRRLGQGP
jgi:predicted flap endonuclease-1-like 5' DNA nuclease